MLKMKMYKHGKSDIEKLIILGGGIVIAIFLIMTMAALGFFSGIISAFSSAFGALGILIGILLVLMIIIAIIKNVTEIW